MDLNIEHKICYTKSLNTRPKPGIIPGDDATPYLCDIIDILEILSSSSTVFVQQSNTRHIVWISPWRRISSMLKTEHR